MSVLRRMVTAGGGLAVALMAAPMIALQAQVVAPGTNPRTPTTNPAPTTKPAPTPTPGAPSQSVDGEMRNDFPFLQEAANANHLEVRLGQLAQGKASSPAVKQFGQRMVTDHTRLQQDLGSMTSRSAIALNPALTPADSAKINRLESLSGAQFDQAYMSMMIQDHQADAAKFENQSRNADSPQVRELAARSLPVLQQHLSLAQQVGRQVNAGVATATPQPAQSGAEVAAVRADRKFIKEIAADNFLEVSLARLAERKAQSSRVKQLAEQIALDHNRIQDDWLAMAAKNGPPIKAGIGKNHRAKLEKLQKLSGRAFDRAYMTMEVQNHKDYIDYFEKEGRSAHSSQVRELVNRDLPTLRSHFLGAKEVGAEVGADTAATIRSERLSSKK
jgi:putative membrane protein